MLRVLLTFLGVLIIAAFVGVGGLLAVFYKFGSDLPDYRQLANYEPAVMTRVHAGDGRLLADSTRQYKPNPWGLYDMHGNVCEWTRTDYEPYPYKTATTKSAGKVARGGSWRDRRKRSTASYRFAYQPYQKVFNVGFRVIVEE